MRPVYFRKDGPITRKIMADMAFLVSHKIIRFPKWLYEEGLYFPYKDKKSGELRRFILDKNNAQKQDNDFYYFNFSFKDNQLEDISI